MLNQVKNKKKCNFLGKIKVFDKNNIFKSEDDFQSKDC